MHMCLPLCIRDMSSLRTGPRQKNRRKRSCGVGQEVNRAMAAAKAALASSDEKAWKPAERMSCCITRVIWLGNLVDVVGRQCLLFTLFVELRRDMSKRKNKR